MLDCDSLQLSSALKADFALSFIRPEVTDGDRKRQAAVRKQELTQKEKKKPNNLGPGANPV